MKTYRLLLLSFLITSLLSCQQEIESNLDGTVQFNLSFQEENVITNSRTSIVSTDDFSIGIFDKGTNEEIAFYERFEDMPSSITLAQGDYKAVASSSGTSTADFNNPSYYGEVDFTVNATELTATTVECYLSNIRVRITHTEDTKTRFPDVVTVVSIGTESLEYTQNENRSGYFPASEESSELKISIQYTQNGILRTSTRTYEASANDFYDISINTQIQGESGLNIKIGKENHIKDEIMIGSETFSTVELLTGGERNLELKSWVFDKLTTGHMGAGSIYSIIPEWWEASPLQLEGLGAYDDVITFKKEGNKFELINNGDIQSKTFMEEWITNRGGELILEGVADNKYSISFEDQSDWTWSVIEKEDGEYLVFGGDAFPSWQVGGTEYLIQSINENELYLRTIGADGNVWYYGFIREGFERPITPPKELQENDIYDDFAGNASLLFEALDGLNFSKTVVNPDKEGNNVDYVGEYHRTALEGEDGWWQRYEAELPYRIDLTNRNVFTMKVYFPSSLDFSIPTPADQTPGFLGEVYFTPTVALRLEDSKMGGSSWETRAESLYTLSEDEMGKWIEVTFDFSTVSAMTSGTSSTSTPSIENTFYDKIVIQIGGEGHIQEGQFYISDFKLL